MNRLLTLSAIVLAACTMQAQEPQLPTSLMIAAKEGLQQLEEQKQQDIAFYAKNNVPQEATSSATPENSGDFYSIYTKDPNNIYYNTYYNNNNDPVLTNMPAPGPNLNYWLVDPCSSGNYDKVVTQ